MGAEPRELPLVNASLNPLAMLRSLREVRRLIRRFRPDVVISYTIKPVILGAIAGSAERIPTIVSLITGVGYAFTEGRETKRRISRAIAAPPYRLALRRSTTIIFQNPDDEALFRQLGLVESKLQTHIVNGSGTDLDHFAPAQLPKQTSFLMIVRLLNRRIGPGRNERRHQHRLLRPGRSRANPDAQRKIGPGDVGGGERSALPDDGRGAGMLALFPAVPGRSADQPDQQLQLRLQVDSARNEPGCARSAGRRRTRLSHGVSS
jgi:hypothetical protein